MPKKPKMWDIPLNSKNYKYYALSRYIGTERTWTSYFRTLKNIERMKKIVSNIATKAGKELNQSVIVALQILSDLSFYYSNESITRILFFIVDSDYHQILKTLLEYKDLLYNHNIPEANVFDIPFNTSFADYLYNLSKEKMF